MRIHRELGPGMLEGVYERLLARGIERRGMEVERQLRMDFSYGGVKFEHAFRLDLIVERSVAVEVKSLDRLAPVHGKQLLTYLRLTNLRVGLLLNFGANRLKDGMKRIVNDLDSATSPKLWVNQ